MRILLLICIGVAASLAFYAADPQPKAALACTAGIAPFEALAGETELIVLGQIVLVGDSTNRAPKLIPRATPTPDLQTPTMPPNPTAPAAAPGLDFDLAGIGATLKITHVFVGTPASELDLGWATRAGIERQLREREAGFPPALDLCGFAAFVPRYVLGAEYLVFMNDYQGILTSWGELRVDGDIVVLNDEGLNRANDGF